MALCEGRPFTIPDDVQTVAGAVLAHRVVLKGGSVSIEASRAAIERVVDSIPVPL
jgi:MoxR-like ATPase